MAAAAAVVVVVVVVVLVGKGDWGVKEVWGLVQIGLDYRIYPIIHS